MTGTGTLALWHSGTIGGVCGPKISLQQLQGVCAPQCDAELMPRSDYCTMGDIRVRVLLIR